jgi:DNA-directed RNA polymerase specialized sigma24 family protein
VPRVAAPTTHDLDSTWPSFLDLLDSDPGGALQGLYEFAWRLSKSRPPSILLRLDPADREERVSELVLKCYDQDFRKLRTYKDMGRPFAAWLNTVLDRQVRDWYRAEKPMEDVPDIPEPQQDGSLVLTARARAIVRGCIDRMTDKCKLYLGCVADGLKPRETAALLLGDSKQISDDTRHCLRKLREMLLAEGIRPDELFS